MSTEYKGNMFSTRQSHLRVFLCWSNRCRFSVPTTLKQSRIYNTGGSQSNHQHNYTGVYIYSTCNSNSTAQCNVPYCICVVKTAQNPGWVLMFLVCLYLCYLHERFIKPWQEQLTLPLKHHFENYHKLVKSCSTALYCKLLLQLQCVRGITVSIFEHT